MKHQKHQQYLILNWDDFKKVFPWHQYPEMRPNQKESFRIIAKVRGSVTLELPTGSGKTAIGYTFLKALEKKGMGPLFYIAPTKTIVEQVQKLHPEVKIVFGRNEYPCLYYRDETVMADEAPCSMLDCPHRVDMETGETEAGGVEPCLYLQAKYEAKKGGIVVCTMAFYLFTHLFSSDWGETAGLVIDEAHKIAKVFRTCLSYDITDYYLEKIVDFLREIGAEESEILNSFLKKMKEIIRLRPPRTAVLLEPWEIQDLLIDLYRIDPNELKRKVKMAVKEKGINPIERRDILKKLETIGRNLVRYLKSLEYSLPTEKHKPLNYTYGYYEKELDENRKVQYRLVINAYRVGHLIQRILSPLTIAYSATISDPEIFGFESGIKFPFYTLGSDFSIKNARVFIPTDTPNLARNSRKRQDLTKTLRRVAKACKTFSRLGLRSLVVVVSNKEREKFLMLCQEEGVDAISYGNGKRPREIVEEFKSGNGKVLVGTVANYGEGVDLPKQLAPVIFFLRPGYPNPNDPGTIFEERRYGSTRWALWKWRVMIEALQVRGRNIRSARDLGVTIFMSQQFRRFIPAALPEWLKDAYCGDKKLEEAIKESKGLLR